MTTSAGQSAEQSSKAVGVVVGSNRANRVCPVISEWFLETAATDSSLRYELLDLAEVDLPFLDEPMMPALGDYQHDHTRSWSARVQSFDAFVFVFPQYNWGYPAVLKNAMDFLYAEWAGKPAGMVTYGTRGGGRAAAQLAVVLQGLHMRGLTDNIQLCIAKEDLDGNWQLADPASTLSPYAAAVTAMNSDLTEALRADGSPDSA